MKDYQKVASKGTIYDSLIKQAAEASGVSYKLMHKMVYIESKFDPKAKSPTGPLGLAQFTKATGKAYGLQTPADRLDPAKAIPAMGRHLKDLLDKTGGDETLAALAYNQGFGGAGRKQVEAFKSGDTSKVSPEGLKYMSMVQDSVADDQVGRWDGSFSDQPKVASTPVETVSKPFSSDTFEALMTPTPMGGVAPKLATFPTAGTESSGLDARTPTRQEVLRDAGRSQDSDDTGTFSGTSTAAANEIKRSTIGAGVRMLTSGSDVISDFYAPAALNGYRFTPQDETNIRDSGLSANYIKTLGGASSSENLQELINFAKTNQGLEESTYGMGTGAQLLGGLAGAIGDPFSYVPIVGQAGKAAQGAKLLSTQVLKRAGIVGGQTALAAGAGEILRANTVGGEEHIAMAMAGGAVFGAGLSVLLDGVTNGIARSVTRLEANETARLTGIESPATRMDIAENADGFLVAADGLEYKPLGTADNAIVLKNGLIISETNPLHPMYQAERSAAALQLGDITEMGVRILRSESNEIRKIGENLVRSSVGTESGSSGVSRMVATDIHDYLKGADNTTFNEFNNKTMALRDDPAFQFKGMSEQEWQEASWRRITDAIEKPEAYASGLTKAEQDLMPIVRDFYLGKHEMAVDPSRFGNPDAKAVMAANDKAGNYVSNIYDDTMVTAMTKAFGGKKGLQKNISDSWMHGYRSNPAVKARVDAIIKSNYKGKDPLKPEMLEELAAKMANDKAYGISNNSEFSYSSSTAEAADVGKGLGTNNFLEARHPFDSDIGIKLADGTDFKVNDLRSYRLDRMMPAYARRMNGDIAIHGSTGGTTQDLVSKITDLQGLSSRDGKFKAESEALMDTVNMLTGRIRQGATPDGVIATLAKAIGDAGFMTKNAYMGPLNSTEIAGLVTKGHTSALLHGVPMLNKLMGGIKSQDPDIIKELSGIVFGRELDNSLRPRRADIRENLRANSNAPDWLVSGTAAIKHATGEASARWPMTKVLQSTTDYIVDAARQGYLNDLVTKSLKGDSTWKESILKSASITPAQFTKMQSAIRRNITTGPDGKLQINPRIMSDPEMFNVWRLGDRMASEAIQRSGSINSASSKALPYQVQLALQFKTFVLRGVNHKFLRSYYEATKNGRPIEMAANASIAIGLAAVAHAAFTHTKSLAMPEGKRKAYLETNLHPNMLAYAALSRSNVLGAPLGVANIIGGMAGIDAAKNVRSTIVPANPYAKDGRPEQFTSAGGTFGDVLDQIPALGLLANAGMAAHNTMGAITTDNRGLAQQYKAGTYNAFRNLIPNDPVSQQILLKFFEAQDMAIETR